MSAIALSCSRGTKTIRPPERGTSHLEQNLKQKEIVLLYQVRTTNLSSPIVAIDSRLKFKSSKASKETLNFVRKDWVTTTIWSESSPPKKLKATWWPAPKEIRIPNLSSATSGSRCWNSTPIRTFRHTTDVREARPRAAILSCCKDTQTVKSPWVSKSEPF